MSFYKFGNFNKLSDTISSLIAFPFFLMRGSKLILKCLFYFYIILMNYLQVFIWCCCCRRNNKLFHRAVAIVQVTLCNVIFFNISLFSVYDNYIIAYYIIITFILGGIHQWRPDPGTEVSRIFPDLRSGWYTYRSVCTNQGSGLLLKMVPHA